MLGILEDRKAENVVSIDVKGRSTLADVIIVATGTSEPHLKALAGAVQLHFKKAGGVVPRVSGDSESAWVVIDLFDVIVHLFMPDARIYYDIETLWKEKPKAKPEGEAAAKKAKKAAAPKKRVAKAAAAKPRAGAKPRTGLKKPAAKAKTAAKSAVKPAAAARRKAAPKPRKTDGAGE